VQRVLLGAVMAMAAGLSACTTAPAAGGGVQTADNSNKICKRMPVMGSNFPKTVCSTAEEWAAFDEAASESVDAYDKDRKAGNTLNDTGNDLGRGD
jgi:hypothetical protein